MVYTIGLLCMQQKRFSLVIGFIGPAVASNGITTLILHCLVAASQMHAY